MINNIVITFEQFVLLEDNNLTFDLVNTQQFYEYVKNQVIAGQFRRAGNDQGIPGTTSDNYKNLFINALSKLFAKEIILGMNKFLPLHDELHEYEIGWEAHAEEGKTGLGNFESSNYADIKSDFLLTPIFQKLLVGAGYYSDSNKAPTGAFANIKDELAIADGKGSRRYLSNFEQSNKDFEGYVPYLNRPTDSTNLKILDGFLKASLSDWMLDKDNNIKDNLYYFLPAQYATSGQYMGLTRFNNNLIDAFNAAVLDKDKTLLRDLNPQGAIDEEIEAQGYDIDDPGVILDIISYADVLRHFMDFVQSRRLNPQNAAKSGVKYANSQTDVMKYFLKSPTTTQMARMVRDFDTKFLPYVNSIEIKANIEENANVLYQWNDGVSIIQPTDEKLCQLIGNEMNHCVGDYDPTDPEQPILQLVDNGKMIATIELLYDMDDDQSYWARMNDGISIYVVNQLKGRFNGPVDGSYSGHLKEFFKKYDAKNAFKTGPFNAKDTLRGSKETHYVGSNPNFQPLMLQLDEDKVPVAIKYPENLSHI